MPDKSPNDYYKVLRQLGMLTFIPMVLVCGPLVGGLLGRWLDLHFKTGQGVMIVLVLLGFAAGATEAYRIIRRASRES